MGKYVVYILRCRDNSLYTGITTDMAKRLHAHNHLPSGASYTRTRRPVVVVYQTAACSKSEALKKEYAIKRLTHAQKEKLTILAHESKDH